MQIGTYESLFFPQARTGRVFRQSKLTAVYFEGRLRIFLVEQKNKQFVFANEKIIHLYSVCLSYVSNVTFKLYRLP